MERSRIGTFFLLVGLVLMILYLGSVLNKDADNKLLVSSLAILFFAYIFRRRVHQDSGRFKTIRRIHDHSRQRREEEIKEEQEE